MASSRRLTQSRYNRAPMRKRVPGAWCWVLGASAACWVLAQGAGAQSPVFRWAGDQEGGAPFVEADPSRPEALVGLDVEIAELLARGLGRRPEFINLQFQSLAQSIVREDA